MKENKFKKTKQTDSPSPRGRCTHTSINREKKKLKSPNVTWISDTHSFQSAYSAVVYFYVQTRTGTHLTHLTSRHLFRYIIISILLLPYTTANLREREIFMLN